MPLDTLTPAGRVQLELFRTEPFDRLWARARALIERRSGDIAGGTFGLSAASDAERLAIAGLLGRPRAGGAVMQVRLAELDVALRSGPLGRGVVDVLALLGTPVRDRAREADEMDRAVAAACERAGASPLSGEAWFSSWLDGLRADGTVRKLIAESQAGVVGAAVRIFEALPADGIPLAALAAELAGSTKALGPGSLATVVLRGLALRAGAPKPTNAAERRGLWESFGVVADDLSSDVLVLNLPTRGRTRLDEWLRGARDDGVALRVTLQQLSKYRLQVDPTRVWICENPAILRAAAQRFGSRCAAMVCSEGQPSTAFDILIDTLARHGCELRYHGDFDWPGLRIAGAIRARHGAAMWRMAAADYRSAIRALNENDLPELSGSAVTAPWDAELVPAMLEVGRAVFEESMLDALLEDLGRRNETGPSRVAATSVRDLITLTRCAHRTHLDRHGQADQRAPTSPFLELLWHDAAVRADQLLVGRNVTRIDREGPLHERHARTLELMRAAANEIAGAVLVSGDLSAEIPLLVRRGVADGTGTHGYVAAVLGSTSSRESSTRKRDALALCGYSELLEDAQGSRPSTGLVIGEGGEHEIDLDAFRPEYRALRRRMRTLLLGIDASSPALKAACRLCRWRAHCHDELRRDDDPTLVPGIGEAERAHLRQCGVTTRTRLADTSPDELEQHLGKRRAQQFVRAARVQRSGAPEVLRSWSRPDVAVDVAYDIEDDPLHSRVYLHGMLVRPRGAGSFGSAGFREPDFGVYHAICATHPAEPEREIWLRFLDRVAQLLQGPTFCVYVFGAHERSTLRRLAHLHGGTDVVDAFAERFVDLHAAISSSVVLPTESMSLKAVAGWLGFAWRDRDPDGAHSAAWWAEYANDPAQHVASRERVIAYNEDDVRATMVVADWLDGFASTPSAPSR